MYGGLCATEPEAMRCRSSWVVMLSLNSRGEAKLKAFDVDVAIVEFTTHSKVM